MWLQMLSVWRSKSPSVAKFKSRGHAPRRKRLETKQIKVLGVQGSGRVQKRGPVFGGQVGRGHPRAPQGHGSTGTLMGNIQLGLPREASSRGLQAGTIHPRECARWLTGTKKRNTCTTIYIGFFFLLKKKYSYICLMMCIIESYNITCR